MTPYFMVNEETLNRTPAEIREYLRFLRRRINELENTDAQRRIDELETIIRGLHVDIEDLQGIINEQKQQIQQLQQELADARAKLGTNSTNSSLPPSLDRFHRKRRPPPDPDQPRKKRGGQPGHQKHERLLVPSEQVSRTIPRKPDTCRRCGHPLTGDDPNPLRHQVAELPPVVPEIIEYQLHRLICPCCHTSTCGALPAEVKGHFGPRLEATLALLAGQYRLGFRPVVGLAADLWGLTISTGMIGKLRRRTAEALLTPYIQVALYVSGQNVNIDETTWREAKKRAYLWAVLTPDAGLFRIAKGRTAEVAKRLLGESYAGVATCDRLKSYWWIKRLQWCWSHLRRDFQAMIDRGRPGKAIGEQLLGQSNTLFHLWHQFRAGALSRRQLQEDMKPVREAVRGVAAWDKESVPANSGNMQGTPGPRAMAVDVRRCRGSATDEQRGRAEGAAWRLVAEDKRRHRQRRRQSICRTGADRRRHLPTARQERPGLSSCVHRGLASQSSASQLASGEFLNRLSRCVPEQSDDPFNRVVVHLALVLSIDGTLCLPVGE